MGVPISASVVPYPVRGLSQDGLEFGGEEGKENSFAHTLNKDWLSTYFVQLTMPNAQRSLFHSFNKQLLRPLLEREQGKKGMEWGQDWVQAALQFGE